MWGGVEKPIMGVGGPWPCMSGMWSASACLRLGPGTLAVPVSCPTPSAPLQRLRRLLSARLATGAVFISWLCVSVWKRLLRMGPIPPTARPAGFSPHPPSATLFILDPSPGGAHGQGLLPEPELRPPPRDCPGPLRSDPSAGKSGHPVSAGPGRARVGGEASPHPKEQTWLQGSARTWGMSPHTPAWLSVPHRMPGCLPCTSGKQEGDTEGEARSFRSGLCPYSSSLPFKFALRKGKRTGAWE